MGTNAHLFTVSALLIILKNKIATIASHRKNPCQVEYSSKSLGQIEENNN